MVPERDRCVFKLPDCAVATSMPSSLRLASLTRTTCSACSCACPGSSCPCFSWRSSLCPCSLDSCVSWACSVRLPELLMACPWRCLRLFRCVHAHRGDGCPCSSSVQMTLGMPKITHAPYAEGETCHRLGGHREQLFFSSSLFSLPWRGLPLRGHAVQFLPAEALKIGDGLMVGSPGLQGIGRAFQRACAAHLRTSRKPNFPRR